MRSRIASSLKGRRTLPTPPSGPSKPLKRDEHGIPRPPVNLLVRNFAPCRLGEHYHNTIRDDLMYMTYIHESKPRRPPRQIRLTYDPEDPYTKFRDNPPVGGSRLSKEPAAPTTSENVVALEKISLHSMDKSAVSNRSTLLGTIMAFRALSGMTEGGGGWRSSEGIQIVRGRKNVGGWIRPGVPVGVKVNLKGDKMYDFLGALVQCVLPRLRDFEGVVLPAASASTNTPSGLSGVVSFGLPPEAMGYFPQIEVNQDAYPKSYGMHIHFVTNAKGVGAQAKARALLSGFQNKFEQVLPLGIHNLHEGLGGAVNNIRRLYLVLINP